MQAALLPERGVVKVAGETARSFLNGLVTADMAKVTPSEPRYAALLTPQGKIIVDFIIAEASAEDGGGLFLDCPRALASTLTERLDFYKLRAKISIENLSDGLGVAALWDGLGTSEYGLVYPDPRLPGLGQRMILPPQVFGEAAADMGATVVDASVYEARRIAFAVPRGGQDFIYNDAFPHEADMDQLGGVDFDKGCFVGQEVVSRMEHRGNVRTRVVAVAYDDFAPECGAPVSAGDKPAGMMGSSARGRGIAIVRLDRVADALAAGLPVTAGGLAIRPQKPDWARFAWPGAAKAAE
jgi:tRNA-modifying protein YgfZ